MAKTSSSPRSPGDQPSWLRHPFRRVHRHAKHRTGWRKHLPVLALLVVALVCGIGGFALLVGRNDGGSPTVAEPGTTNPLALRTSTAPPVADGDTGGATTSTTTGTTQPRDVREYCRQAGALNLLRPTLKLTYAVGNLALFRTSYRSFVQQLEFLLRIAPDDVRAPTQTVVNDFSKLGETVEQAKQMSAVTAYADAHLTEIFTHAEPWLQWLGVHCPSVLAPS